MSDFSCDVVEIEEITPIDGADQIELARVGDYYSVIKKGVFNQGDVVVYIPEQAIVPDIILEKLGLQGKLSGSKKNRVKAIKLRGCLSQGLIYPIEKYIDGYYLLEVPERGGALGHADVSIGDDVTEVLGVVKHEPKIPAQFAGSSKGYGPAAFSYDINNLKKFNKVFQEGELVEFTEKLHGSFMRITVFRGSVDPDFFAGGHVCIASKGLGKQGIVFKNVEENEGNAYVRCFKNKLEDKINGNIHLMTDHDTVKVHIMGELYGNGIQDLTYGEQDTNFRVFDIAVEKTDGSVTYLDRQDVINYCMRFGFDTVPVLYTGPYSKEIADEYVNGKDTLSNSHVREGIVIRRVVEGERDRRLGRVILKHVSGDYLTRKGGTEFN